LAEMLSAVAAGSVSLYDVVFIAMFSVLCALLVIIRR
jgi:hypothetical protein